MEMISGITGIQNLNNITAPTTSLKNVNSTGGYENMYKMDNFLNGNDPQLTADLQGIIEKNQFYNADKADVSSISEVTPADVADKFSDVLGNYLKNVNGQDHEAEKAVETLASGGNIDLHSVMIASEKAHLSMELAIQLRNKFVQAYQEISRISV